MLQLVCDNSIAKIGREGREICRNCGNGIAENGGKKCGSKSRESKKKKCYVHNIFTISHMWLVIISSNLNLTLRLFFYLFRQCHCHNSIPLFFFFFFLRNDKCTQFSQYFYNIFTTNHKWLVIISSNLNLILRLFF